MTKNKVILILGKSGTGKDTLVKKLCANSPTFYRVVSATTRPKRDKEIQDYDYHFCLSEEEFYQFDVIDHRVFRGWHYGTPIQNLKKDRINVIITDPIGLNTFLLNDKLDIIKIFLIETSDKQRLIRQLNRVKKPDVDEIIRRFQTDNADFLEFKSYIPWLNLEILQNEIPDDLNEISKYIQGLV